MKHLNKLRLALCAAAVVVAVAFFACNKEKEQANIQQPTEADAARKPIATYDNATGQMTYHVSVEQLQAAMNNFTASKGEDEYLVESWQILEDDPSGLPYLKFVLLNIQDESSLSIYLFDCFVERHEINDGTEYRLNKEVEIGNYHYYISPKDDVYYVVTVKNGTDITIEPWEGNGTKAMPGGSGTVLTCLSKGCVDPETECRLEYYDYLKKRCTPCAPPGQCDWTESSSVTAALMRSL